MAAARAEVAVGVAGNAGLVMGHGFDVQFRGLHEFVEAAADDRIPACVDDDRGLQPVRGGDPPAPRPLDGMGHLAGIWFGAQDRDEG